MRLTCNVDSSLMMPTSGFLGDNFYSITIATQFCIITRDYANTTISMCSIIVQKSLSRMDLCRNSISYDEFVGLVD